MHIRVPTIRRNGDPNGRHATGKLDQSPLGTRVPNRSSRGNPFRICHSRREAGSESHGSRDRSRKTAGPPPWVMGRPQSLRLARGVADIAGYV